MMSLRHFQVDWDLVIIDEAHKCSARTQGDLRAQGATVGRRTVAVSERFWPDGYATSGNVDQFHNF